MTYRKGYATAVSYPPDVSCYPTLSEVQFAAKDNQLGMWIPTAPFPMFPKTRALPQFQHYRPIAPQLTLESASRHLPTI